MASTSPAINLETTIHRTALCELHLCGYPLLANTEDSAGCSLADVVDLPCRSRIGLTDLLAAVDVECSELPGAIAQLAVDTAKNRARPGQIKVPDTPLDFLECVPEVSG